jgi:hypothetical protein
MSSVVEVHVMFALLLGSSECISELLVPQLSLLMGKERGGVEASSLTLASCTFEQVKESKCGAKLDSKNNGAALL